MHSSNLPIRNTIVATALIVLAGCASGGVPVTRTGPAAVGPAEIAPLAELLRLEDRREFDAERLGALGRHANPIVRGRTALAAGRIGDPRGSALVRRAMTDSTASVRADGAFAAGELNDTTPATIDLLAQLLRAASGHPDGAGHVPAAVEAAAALGKLAAAFPRGSVAGIARENLVRAAGADSTWRMPAPVVREALLALWRFPRTDGAVSVARTRIRDADPETRWRAAYALMRMGPPTAVPELRAALRDSDPTVRELAARALRASAVDSAGARTAVIPELAALLEDPVARVRINALRALGSFRDSTLVPRVAARLRDADGNVAVAAAEALPLLGSPAILPLDNLAIDSTARLALRGAAVAGLFRLAPDIAFRRLDALAASTDPLARLYAARSLAGGRWVQVEPRARRFLRDADPRVAAAALESIAAVVDDTVAPAYAFYLEGVAAADPGIRAAALRGLAQRASPADLPVLLDAYERAQADTIMNDAAIAAVDALGAIAEKGSPVARSFFLRFRPPADPVVRAEVAARLGPGDWGEPRPIETRRDSTYYQSVVRDLLIPGLQGAPAPAVRITGPSGALVIELLPGEAPITVRNFLDLVGRGYYRGTRWHRVVPNFVLQDGDPRGDGSGGPGYSIRDEINRVRYLRGTVGMALAGPDTGGSQFFVTHSPQPHLDGGYTVFGRVVEGIEAADRVVQDDPLLTVERIR